MNKNKLGMVTGYTLFESGKKGTKNFKFLMEFFLYRSVNEALQWVASGLIQITSWLKVRDLYKNEVMMPSQMILT